MKRIIIALALLASTATAQAQNYAKPDPNAPPAPTLPGPGRVALPGDEIRLRIPWTIGCRDKMLLSEWYGLVKADRLAMAAEFAGDGVTRSRARLCLRSLTTFGASQSAARRSARASNPASIAYGSCPITSKSPATTTDIEQVTFPQLR